MINSYSYIGNDPRPVLEPLKSIEEMPMKMKTEEKNTTKKKTAKKKAATKTATPPKALPTGLHKKQGVWVFSTGEPISHAQMERIRRSIQRERENSWMGNLGKTRAKS